MPGPGRKPPSLRGRPSPKFVAVIPREHKGPSIKERAWKLYLTDTTGRLIVVDSFSELPEDIQTKYLRRAMEEQR